MRSPHSRHWLNDNFNPLTDIFVTRAGKRMETHKLLGLRAEFLYQYLRFIPSPVMNPRILFVAARVALASVFVGLGLERLLSAAGVLDGRFPPTIPGLLFAGFELAAGTAIMFGWQLQRIGLLLAVFLAVDAFTAHTFWKREGIQQHMELLNFLLNISAVGWLLLVGWMDANLPRKPRVPHSSSR